MERGDATLLIGFNEPSLARTPLMQSVVGAMASARNAHLLTPNVGPEALAGSSRMKGGSATLVLLDALCAGALAPERSLAALVDDHRRNIVAAHARHAAPLADALRAATRAFAARPSRARVAFVAEHEQASRRQSAPAGPIDARARAPQLALSAVLACSGAERRGRRLASGRRAETRLFLSAARQR